MVSIMIDIPEHLLVMLDGYVEWTESTSRDTAVWKAIRQLCEERCPICDKVVRGIDHDGEYFEDAAIIVIDERPHCLKHHTKNYREEIASQNKTRTTQ